MSHFKYAHILPRDTTPECDIHMTSNPSTFPSYPRCCFRHYHSAPFLEHTGEPFQPHQGALPAIYSSLGQPYLQPATKTKPFSRFNSTLSSQSPPITSGVSNTVADLQSSIRSNKNSIVYYYTISPPHWPSTPNWMQVKQHHLHWDIQE